MRERECDRDETGRDATPDKQMSNPEQMRKPEGRATRDNPDAEIFVKQVCCKSETQARHTDQLSIDSLSLREFGRKPALAKTKLRWGYLRAVSECCSRCARRMTFMAFGACSLMSAVRPLMPMTATGERVTA